jgi:hypothetical protein
MMEIKFRQWIKRANQFHYFSYREGFLQGPAEATLSINPIYQYIGCQDKNGIDIYEDNILESDGELFKVGFEKGCFGVRYLNEEYCKDFDSCIDFDKMKIVGNIYEYMELLK